MDGEKGKFLFLFNHGENAAEVEFAQKIVAEKRGKPRENNSR
jgi:hypothetical protein